MNRLLKQIHAEVGTIEGVLDKAGPPYALDIGAFKTASRYLITMHGKVKQEIPGLEKQEQGLKKSTEELSWTIAKTETEVGKLQEKYLEKHSGLDRLREIVRQMDLPETKGKSARSDWLKEEVRQLSEEKKRLNKEIAPLQKDKDLYEELNKEINESIANMHTEETKIAELKEKIADGKAIIDDLKNKDLPQKENQKNRALLHALRLAIKARQKNMYTPGWERLMMLLELGAAKEDDHREQKIKTVNR